MKIHSFIIALLFVMGSFSPTFAHVLEFKPTNTNESALQMNQSDIPTWYIGDYWTYQTDIYSNTENGTFDLHSTDLTIKVSNISNYHCINQSIDAYHLTISGNITGTFSSSIISGDVDGTITGESYVRRADLSILESNVSISGTITVIIVQKDFEINSYGMYFPPMEYFDFPIVQGEEWNMSTNVTSYSSIYVEDTLDNETYVNESYEGIVSCLNIEDISVPAGNFQTFHLKSQANGTIETWFAPQTRNVAKAFINQSSVNETTSIYLNLSTFSLNTPQVIIYQSITPTPSTFDEMITISGSVVNTSSNSTIPNANMEITIPQINQTWYTTTNQSGCYEISIITPYIQDYTETIYDAGSDGVIATTNTSLSNNYEITTLVVIMNTIQITNLSNGWNFIAMPFNQSVDTTAIIMEHNGSEFNWTEATTSNNPTNSSIVDPNIFGWKRDTQSYYSTSLIKPGYGYWMYCYKPCTLLVKQKINSTDGYITIVTTQWNTIGSNTPESIPLSSLKVTFNSTRYNWTEATTSNNPTGSPLIDPNIFGWNISQNYDISTHLQPGKAYWVYCYQDCIFQYL